MSIAARMHRWAFAALLAAPAANVYAANYECLIEPIQTVEVRSPVEGLIERITVQRGDWVRRGQVLVQLESAPERSSVELARYRSQMEGRIVAARNRLDYAEQKAARQRDLADKGFISAQALDESVTELKLAEAEFREANENRELAQREQSRAEALLGQRQLRSPLNGVVMDRMLNPGDLAESGTGRKPILTLAQLDPLRIEAVLPISAYGKVKRGMAGLVHAEGFGSHAATVQVVDPVLDAASGTFRVRLEMRGGKNSPPGGLRCQVELPAPGWKGPTPQKPRVSKSRAVQKNTAQKKIVTEAKPAPAQTKVQAAKVKPVEAKPDEAKPVEAAPVRPAAEAPEARPVAPESPPAAPVATETGTSSATSEAAAAAGVAPQGAAPTP